MYRLIHQAALGSEHAISNLEDAGKWMEHVLAEMGAGADKPVMDPIFDDEQIMRVGPCVGV